MCVGLVNSDNENAFSEYITTYFVLTFVITRTVYIRYICICVFMIFVFFS